MTIRDIFQKPINREIKGVIKVGQGEDQNVKQELEEYVVTRELQKHFSDFFSAYKAGIIGTTDKMGVWISGFFGSGKSHFLKILSYLLENRVVDGKAAIDYFIDDNKILDRTVLADMKLAADTSTDVILFNVDSKGESTGKQDKDAIVSVFLKAFNEMQGFCGAFPFVADLERRLTEEGKYQSFKEAFEASNGSSWLEERYAIDFVQDDIVDALSQIGFMSEDAARNWCEKATDPYAISIERFADLVKKYIDSKGSNHHVVFLVDEIGQYIGDDSKLMLNLQTVTEDLGTACHGKAWVIVTSQEDIDSITKTKGNDFSKIQGRFDTRLSLSAANVSEVIQKRILEKTEAAKQMLSMLYDEKATVIKNLIEFKDGIDKKLYKDRENFSAVYPFVPYQFDLLGSVLTSIRTYGASGKHLSDGARSMLALFKESAVKLCDKEPGVLVPFYMFYQPLEAFIDHSHKDVILKAMENDYLNPNHEKECFDVDVLKTLFMIKYVKEIQATSEQIASLMVSHIDEDRLSLQQRVDESLKRLIRQTLVQKNGDTYVFLTNEEQEINRAIDQQPAEADEVRGKISEMIFDGIYDEKKYRFPKMNGRYSFGFNQIVDGKPYKANQNYPLSLRIITPAGDEKSDDATMRMLSGQTQCVLVVLPDDRTFVDEIQTAIRIEKFIKFDTMSTVSKYAEIKASKQAELREHNAQARLFLEEALKAADIYMNGSKVQSTMKDVSSRINEAMGKLAEIVFHKLSYIDTSVTDSDVRSVLTQTSKQLSLAEAGGKLNGLALNEAADYIGMNTAKHLKTSMKTFTDHFQAPPYGFIEVDVQWLVARLFKDGDISLFVNNEAISLMSKTPDEVYRYITRKEYLEKLMLDKREKANDRQKKSVRDVSKELFGITISAEEDDEVMSTFLRYAGNMKGELEKLEVRYEDKSRYPGKAVVQSGKRIMADILQLKYPGEFFSTIDSKVNDYLDFAEDYEPVKKFFAGEQKEIFDKAVHLMGIYEDSKTYIVDSEIESTAAEIHRILWNPKPYMEIKNLPMLRESFIKKYSKMLKEMEAPVMEAVSEARARVFNELDSKLCHDTLANSFLEKFDELKDKVEHCNNVATLQNIKVEADALKVRCLNEIEKTEAGLLAKKQAEEAAKQAESSDSVQPGAAPAPVPERKKKRTVSIKSMTNQASWQVETPEDIKKYMAALEKKLLDSLEEGTILNIEF